MEALIRYLKIFSEMTSSNLGQSLIILVLFWLLKTATCFLAQKKIKDPGKVYHLRRVIVYTYSFMAIFLIGRIWIKGIGSIATFLGLVSAGLTIALRDLIANIAGWFIIIWRKPFLVGERIQIGTLAGDVIDVRLLEFSIIEIRNWVDAEQNTGRIVHVPNSMILHEPLANYETGFEYIWNEIPVLITFESNWEKAKGILSDIARDKAEPLSAGAEQQIRRAAMKYFIYFKKLTPIVYTSVRDSGVLLTIRYIVKPRGRRGSEEEIWESILREFAKHDDISLAYSTTRFYQGPEAHGASANRF